MIISFCVFTVFIYFISLLIFIIVAANAAEDYHERKSRASRWEFGKALLVSTHRNRLDKLMSDAMCWISYGDHCAFREFELISLFS